MLKALPPLSLYIHIPWCERKCPYCDFNSHEKKKSFNENEYIECLIKDFKKDLSITQNRPLNSIFIGGGTPSLFKVESIEKLLQAIKKEIDFSNDIEITLEANPTSSQGDYFNELSETLVNRVSLGVQSFQNEKLEALGRLHSSDEAQQALVSLKNNFHNFNVDLMFGLPDQTLEDSFFDIETALSFNPPHLSWYQLTIEPNTVFYRNEPLLPNDDFIFEMQQKGIRLLKKHALHQYELSAFSTNSKQCIHNRNYWQFGDYLAIGAGAHGKISRIENGSLNIYRFNKSRSPKDYIDNVKNNCDTTYNCIPRKELALEFFMNSLRLNEPISFDLFFKRTQLTELNINNFCEKAQALNLITVDDNYIKKTSLGSRHVDSILELF